jgi:hypothetical protein
MARGVSPQTNKEELSETNAVTSFDAIAGNVYANSQKARSMNCRLSRFRRKRFQTAGNNFRRLQRVK